MIALPGRFHSLPVDTEKAEIWLSDFSHWLPPVLAGAVRKRKIDYIAGRLCADQALTSLDPGTKWQPVPMGQDRLPAWPSGIVGSITHTASRAAAAVGFSKDFQGIGIDTQDLMSLETFLKVHGTIAAAQEMALVKNTGYPEITAASLIFSVKESVFKCLFPLVKIRFGFMDARVSAIKGDHIEIELLRELTPEWPAGSSLEGRFRILSDLVETSVVLRRRAGARML